MVDFTILDKSLKAAWVKRLCEADGIVNGAPSSPLL